MSVQDAALTETLELLSRAHNGDRDAFQRVLDIHRGPLLGRIRLMMGPAARRIAESGDFLGEVFVEVLERFDGFEPRTHDAFLRWTTRIARNRIHDSVRKRREQALGRLGLSTMSGLRGDQETPSTEAAAREAADKLADALEQLPEDRLRVVELREFDGLSYAEIAEQLGRTENAVQLLHARAIVQLGRIVRHPGSRSAEP